MSSEDKSFADEVADDAFNETENKGAITRSIHIMTNLMEVTITSQDPNEDLKMIKKMAMELVDRYKDNAPIYE